MSKEASNLFEKFEFTDIEIAPSRILNLLQEQNIKTIQCNIAENKLRLRYEPGMDKEKFVFENEYFRGQLEILQYILDLSESAKQDIYLSINHSDKEVKD